MRIGIHCVDAALEEALGSKVTALGHDPVLIRDRDGIRAAMPALIFAEWSSRGEHDSVTEILRAAKDLAPAVPVVLLAPRGWNRVLQRAADLGAQDVLFAPPEDAEVKAEIEHFLSSSDRRGPIDRVLLEEIRSTELVGESEGFKRCLAELSVAALSEANVLLRGDTGTGKEIFAHAIHRLSSRRKFEFLPVNCAAFPGALLESELFGHAKGAFTGADHARQGRFETVGEGTLLLDEIGDLDPALQTKLLRVVEQRQFERLGENASRKFQARLIAATSVNLEEAIQSGRFRRDLLGRLDQIRITLPAMRDRLSDIPLLARHFLKKHGKSDWIDISPSALTLLFDFSFPMNVRQMENMMISALARCGSGSLILPVHLPEDVRGARHDSRAGQLVIQLSEDLSYQEARIAAQREIDRIYLPRLLAKHAGNQSSAANEANIDRKTFAARLSLAESYREEGT